MLKMSDLEAAVAEGIISQAQAERLRDFARRLTAGGDSEALEFSQDTRDEPFRLLRGFRDVFIAIGIAIFAVGLSSLTYSFTTEFVDFPELALRDRVWNLAMEIVLLVVGMVLAEWITRRQRLPLASLVISIAFGVWSAGVAVMLCNLVAPSLFTDETPALALVRWLSGLGAFLGLIGFYWRYRLPFTLLPLAASAAGFILFALSATFANAWTDLHARILIGVLGVVVFLAAMWFDMKDPLRVKRFAECGFWLHLLAAPMMVHALLLGQTGNAPDLLLILGAMAVLALVALLIDRRALLVAGLSYLAVAIAQIVSRSEALGGLEFAVTASVLGACVLCLGLGWTPIRRLVLAAVPADGLKAHLPPVASG